MTTPLQQPLSSSYQHGSPAIKLYDDEVMLDIDEEKARGFLVLLRGGEEEAQRLAFMALTDGNVVDACIGAPPMKREGARYHLARETKNALAAASDSSESIAKLATETYQRALQLVVDHHAKINRVLICCRCFVRGRIRRKTKEQLKHNFAMLQEAVEASTK
mmetsp:Transcript_10592/g.15593  ORF Transcript_10592/g.15593 Transcript_10592/m.15593 type:complete len:162 (-) Transcript_10592:223-708(-)|eukprot:CAMPEP_0194215788 /NCGR_PEP_ID=MMETSP0156-20130528/17822_1 /TAXON_ID=33649 /ORGANISM="Thalassionema nitzschioides, Strain L26-B" /LENGTH=161 /DNA_ID=CAMNT_0038944397 /DNA_START=138 /DNA_END=623 /DNA_ORIENTATION=+